MKENNSKQILVAVKEEEFLKFNGSDLLKESI